MMTDAATALASKAEQLLREKADSELDQSEGRVEISGRLAIAVDPSKPQQISSVVHRNRLEMAANMAELETNVQYCLAAKIEWLEVGADVLAYLCGGKYPQEDYMIYKNLRVCAPGMSEEIARRERLTVNEILFKGDGKQYHIGKPK